MQKRPPRGTAPAQRPRRPRLRLAWTPARSRSAERLTRQWCLRAAAESARWRPRETRFESVASGNCLTAALVSRQLARGPDMRGSQLRFATKNIPVWRRLRSSSGLSRHCSPHTRRETWLPSLRLPPVTSPRVRRDTRERAAHRLARSTDVARIYPPRGRTPAHPLRSHLGCLLSQARRSSRPSARSATSPRPAAATSRYVAARREQEQARAKRRLPHARATDPDPPASKNLSV